MKKITLFTALLAGFCMGSTVASANQGANKAFNDHYINPASCTECHTSTAKPIPLTPFGIDWKAQGGTSQAGPSTQAGWDALDVKYANQYGGVNPNWVFSPPTPVATASVTGCVSGALSTPLMMLFSLFSLGFLLRRKKGNHHSEN
jgi:hypothetical protein